MVTTPDSTDDVRRLLGTGEETSGVCCGSRVLGGASPLSVGTPPPTSRPIRSRSLIAGMIDAWKTGLALVNAERLANNEKKCLRNVLRYIRLLLNR